MPVAPMPMIHPLTGHAMISRMSLHSIVYGSFLSCEDGLDGWLERLEAGN